MERPSVKSNDIATMIKRTKSIPATILPIITVEHNAEKPLHRQIYDAYRTAIVNGSLRAGQRVPSTRMLASELGLSRFPVFDAYAQLLAEGYLETRIGAGTVISQSLPDEQMMTSELRGPRAAKARPGPRPFSKRAANIGSLVNAPGRRGWGAFGVNQVAHEHFPFRIWNSLVMRHSRSLRARGLDYGDPLGSPNLREAIATYLRTARGVQCEAQQIMIVGGSQQGLEITARVLLDPGSPVWMEEPGCSFARNVFAVNDCVIVPVPVDYEGLNVAAGVKRCPKAQAALVMPSHQYPLGVIMSASRRMQLLDWAQKAGSWIIEVDYGSEFRYESEPIASLQGLDANARVIYVGTFSRVLFPSLRLGYIVIPTDLIEHFVSVRVAMDLGPSSFHQVVLADFINEGHFPRHLRRMRLLYGERRRVLMDCIRKEFGFGVDISGGKAGMHLSVTFKGIRDQDIARRACTQNLWLTPLSTSYLGQAPWQGFVLGFGSTSAEAIPAAVRKLRAMLAK